MTSFLIVCVSLVVFVVTLYPKRALKADRADTKDRL